MATSKDFISFLEKKLETIPTFRTRAMFGECALYLHDRVVALVCDNTIFLKVTPKTTALMGAETEKGPAYPGSKDFYIVDERMLDDISSLAYLLEQCSRDIPPPKPKSPKKR